MKGSQAIIIGASHTGAVAAMELRKAGFAGDIALIGEEAHLPYERPQLSKDLLLNPDAEEARIYDRAAFAMADIDLMLGSRVIGIDRAARRITLADKTVMAFEHLLLATGGKASKLGVPGGDLAMTLRTVDDACKLKAALRRGLQIVIIGAGVIGLEVASSAAFLGCQVTVLERQSGPMARSLEPTMQDFVTDLHREAGVTMEFGIDIAAIERSKDGAYYIILADGAMRRADLVIAGVGWQPRVELAQAAGLTVANGVVVDEFGGTSDPAIRAAGDVANFWHPHHGRHLHWQTWQHAQNHGKAVAQAIAGPSAPYTPAYWFWTDQHRVNIQVAGFPTDGTDIAIRGNKADRRFAVFHLRDDAIVGATLVNQGGLNRPVQDLIRSGRKISMDFLTDPATSISNLVRGNRGPATTSA